MREIYPDIEKWEAGGHSIALATVVETWGSSPREAGSAMAIREDLQITGSVSGGCIEGAVIEEAQQVMKSGQARLLEFGVANEDAWAVGLSCGGRIKVLVEPLPDPAIRESLRQAWNDEKGIILLQKITEGTVSYHLIDPAVTGDEHPGISAELLQGALAAYRRRQSLFIEAGDAGYFIQIFPPRPQMIIIGAGHLSVALLPLARELNFRTIVIDPRGVFANESRFPVAPDELLCEWPQEVLPRLTLHEETYAVLLTHDPKIDDPALHILLRSPMAYVGALGSRRTHAKRRERLLESGFSEAEIARIAAPVGLDLGARTPQEIAVSIMAQIVERRRKGAEEPHL